MKSRTMVILLVLTSRITYSTDFYISSNGSDSSDGRSVSSSWRTIEKVNSEIAGLRPGDRILFRRGDIFFGTLKITISGLPGNPLVLGGYGEGQNPIITGFAAIREWKSSGRGIYSCPLECESATNMVTVNDINTPMGRWPDKELLTIDSHASNNSITDAELPSFPDWTGSELVIRKNAYIWDRNKITGHSGNTLNYSSGSYYEARNGYGYFIQNDLKTLDQPGEWYYDGEIFYMYFGDNHPRNYTVNVSVLDQLVYLNNIRHVTFENISFKGANVYAFQIRNSGNITIRDCNIDFTGGTAIYGPWWGNSTGCRILNNIINHSNSNGIQLYGDHKYAEITGNYVRNTGLIPGMGGSGDGTYNAIAARGDNTLIQYNTVENSGYMGINFGGNNTVVANNFVNNFNLLKNDGGGIYTYIGTGTPCSGQKVTGNIVLNGIGMPDGTPDNLSNASGIYIDDRARNIKVLSNTIANCSTAGIYLHNAHEVEIVGNSVLNNGYGSLNHGSQILLVHDSYSPDNPIRNVHIFENIFFASDGTRKIIAFSTKGNDVSDFGLSDNNYYIRLSGDNKIIRIWEKGWNGPAINLSLKDWILRTGKDSCSKTSPDIISNIKNLRFRHNPTATGNIITLDDSEMIPDFGDVRFEYNPSVKSRIISLEGNTYMDVKGSKYEGCFELVPYSSLILIRLQNLR